ncbi:MAG TPA: hypothetical protein LFW20_00555 [Rickettsia endosymbiont of Omalisus fontisbellaquei]|nr:hypothetical protein [Rickettsia endosymbiont of Omalisus fontisbellaquei]
MTTGSKKKLKKTGFRYKLAE